ncbi:hypothetical protein AA0488_0104 [Kozakia baliensis NRIC 0488]|nr:hypothetical protein AA0488_0104 [Kozakia baliensis NRIC 0488]GEL65795.1 hypothetical protein KBA01_30810 [Kozakia baliensis]
MTYLMQVEFLVAILKSFPSRTKGNNLKSKYVMIEGARLFDIRHSQHKMV